MKATALVKNAVRITATFRAWSGGIADAENTKLNVYENRTLKESIPLDNCKIGLGTYRTYYIIPDCRKELMFEMIGDVEGLPETARCTIEKRW